MWHYQAAVSTDQYRSRTRDARKFIDKYKRLEIAIDAYYNEPMMSRQTQPSAPSTSKLNQVFDQYKGVPPHVRRVRGCLTPIGDVQIRMERISRWTVPSSSAKISTWIRRM